MQVGCIHVNTSINNNRASLDLNISHPPPRLKAHLSDHAKTVNENDLQRAGQGGSTSTNKTLSMANIKKENN